VIERVREMKGILPSVVIVALLISACSGAKNGETATPTATAEMEARVAATHTPYPTYTPQPTYTPLAAQPSALTSTPTDTSGTISTSTGAPVSTDTPTSTPTPPTPTPEPVVYIVRAGDSLAVIARAYGVTVAAIAEASNIQDVNAIHVGQGLTIPDPVRIPTGPIVQPHPPVGDGGQTAVTSMPALEQLSDTDPGPPLTIQVSAVRIRENGNYQVTGWVRNDGAQVYGGIGVIATFFTELECGEVRVPNKGRNGQAGSGSVEYGCAPNWHGPIEVYAPCPLLAPGAECPFSLEIYPRDYVAYHLHPEGAAIEYREPAAVELSGVQVVDAGSNTVRIVGTATNANSFAVKNVIVSGVLLDAGGQMVSIGSTFGLEEDIAPGVSVLFGVRVAKEPYVRYRLYAQAERDWD